MTTEPRQCHHDTTSHDYATPLRHSETLRIDRVCGRCDKTLQTWHANAEEGQQSNKRSIMDFAGIWGPMPEGFDVVEWQRAMRDE